MSAVNALVARVLRSRIGLTDTIAQEIAASVIAALPYEPRLEPLTEATLERLGDVRRAELRALELLDDIDAALGGRSRWTALGRTHIELGFMALRRAVTGEP